MSQSQNIVNSSLKAASLNMMTQVIFRLVTFVMNAYVLRYISRDVLGLIYVRLNLLDDTIIFLSTEGFRLAGLGHNRDSGSWQQTVNLMWLTLPLATLWSSLMGWVWLSWLPAPPHELASQYHQAVIIVALSGVGQMLAEAPMVVGQVLMFVRLRVVMNMLWMTTRVIVLCLAVTMDPDNVILIWAWGHALAAAVYVLGYYFAFRVILKTNKIDGNDQLPIKSMSQLLPSRPSQFSLDPDQRRVASSFLGQAVVKQVLTDCEKYVMTIFNLLTLSEQGIFDVVSNLGSLAARFIFRPAEESAYFFFSQLWSRGAPIEDQDDENYQKVQTGLFRLLRMMLYLGKTPLTLHYIKTSKTVSISGLIIVFFGYSYSHFVLHLYGGRTLSEGLGPDLLRSQCFLILFLAINGVTECFARAVMTDGEINTFTQAMTLMSVAYIVLTYTLASMLGPVGMVMANCCNMLIRIAAAVRVIINTFKDQQEQPITGLVPDTDITLLLISAGATCLLSEVYIYAWSALAHLAIGAVMFLVVVVAVVIKEDYILEFLAKKFRSLRGGDITEEEGEKSKAD